MATVTRFEDLGVWKKAREFNRRVYQITRARGFARDYAMVDQIRRASLSVMNNIAEGFERFRRNEFMQFLSTAKGSAGEVRSMLYTAYDAGYLEEQQFSDMMAHAVEVANALGSFRAGLERSTPKVLPGRSKSRA